MAQGRDHVSMSVPAKQGARLPRPDLGSALVHDAVPVDVEHVVQDVVVNLAHVHVHVHARSVITRICTRFVHARVHMCVCAHACM